LGILLLTASADGQETTRVSVDSSSAKDRSLERTQRDPELQWRISSMLPAETE